MNLLLKAIGILVSIFFIYHTISLVMDFLGIKVQFYISYLLWCFALILFWAILPKQEKYFI